VEAGTVFSQATSLYTRFWLHLVTISFVVFLGLTIATTLLAIALGVIGALIGLVLSLVGTFWLQGALAEAVADVRDGRSDLSVGETFRKAWPRVWTLAGAGILAGLGIALGLLLLVVPGVVLLVWWSALVPVIVLEQRGIGEAFTRSRELVRGHFWPVFRVVIGTIALLFAVSIVLSIAFSPLNDTLSGLLQSLISNTLVTPFLAVAWTVTYFELRKARGEPDPAPAPAPLVPS